MTRLEFAFGLFEYSVALLAIGMVMTVLLRLSAEGWPKPRKRWAYPMLFTCFGALLIVSVVSFVMLVRAF